MERSLIEEYFQSLVALLADMRLVRSTDITLDKRGEYTGLIRGNIYFADQSLLHFRELVSLEFDVTRVMYVYHYQRADNTLVFRYDNTDHPTKLTDTRHHKHAGTQSNVISTSPPDLATVLKEIENLVE
jgi:hypothetical protein